MAIPLLEDDLNIIGAMGDFPGTDDGLTPDEFKRKFDVAGNLIKEFLNNVLIPQTNLILDPDVIIDFVLKSALDTKGGTMSGNLDMGGNVITGLGDPTADGDAVSRKFLEQTMQDAEYIYRTVTIPAAGWANKQQTVTVAGIEQNCDLTVSPEPVRANVNNFSDAGILCIYVNKNTLIFECDSVPTADVTVNIKFRNM